jgi:uroporphyrin-III C-methyltransferase/precorrin-2 dehydrogenase/sirohydrochlorin ferrochelatase
MDYLPLFFKADNRWILLVGGGQVALRKAKLVLRAGAKLRVVADDICAELADILKNTDHEVFVRTYQHTDLDKVALVIAATDDLKLNSQIAQDADQANIPVNVVDQPELCSFIFPSIVDRSPLVVAVSSGGKSPVPGCCVLVLRLLFLLLMEN